MCLWSSIITEQFLKTDATRFLSVIILAKNANLPTAESKNTLFFCCDEISSVCVDPQCLTGILHIHVINNSNIPSTVDLRVRFIH